MSKWHLGVDVSKDWLDVALLEGEELVRQARYANNPQGIRRLLASLSGLEAEEGMLCMEATGTYHEGLAEAGYAAGWRVVVLNPARVRKHAESHSNPHKTDRLDAWLIADYARTHHKSLWFWQPLSPELKLLRALVRRRRSLRRMLTQEQNRLKSGSCQLIQAQLEESIAWLQQQIKDLDRAIRRFLRQQPDLARTVRLLETIKGIGFVTASALLAEIGRIELFKDARQLAAFFGVHPGLRESGSSGHRKSRLTKRGRPALRALLFMPAIVAQRHNPLVRASVERHLARGHCKASAVGVAMHHLLRLVFGVWRSGRPFDPHFLAQEVAIA